MEDYYKILGVSKDASIDDIKKSYRQLSLRNHPDRNKSPQASENFARINSAYEVLSDERKKRQYDMQQSMGISGFPGMAGMTGFPGMPGMFGGSGVEVHNMDDIFSNILGGMAGMAMGGQPEVHVFSGNGMGSFPEIIKNMQKPVPITKTINITMEQSYYGGSFSIEIERWFILNGSKVNEKDNLNVTIPPGVDNNEIIILREKGNINKNNKGDVKIFINIGEHPYFIRQGIDLLYKKTITLKEALCGFSFEIQHLNKRVISFNNSTSNALIHPGYRKIVNDLGFKKENHLGNLIIEFNIEFPENLSEEQINKLRDIL
jgi:DnaJ-class molecular chaperone